MHPQEIRRSEIASEAIFGAEAEPQQLHGLWSYISNFWLSMYAFDKTADFEFPREKVLCLALETGSGVTSLEGQQLNF